MAVGLGEEAPFYLELEALGLVLSDGAPRVQATIYNIPPNQKIRLQRACGGEVQIVQGGRNLAAAEVAILTDWAAPLNRPAVYTVLVDGEPQSTATITIHSDVAWLQDPLDPTSALPVESKRIRKGALLLDSKAVSSANYVSEATEIRVMGARYPRYFSGPRSGAKDVQLSMWSDDEPTETTLRLMVAEAPILLFRPLPRHRLLPPVVYIAGDVAEDQRTVRLGQDLTHWTVQGNIVQPMGQAPLTGFVTYDQVQELLAGKTYDAVQAVAGSTVYLDWRKDPLIFQNL